jgi:hypothetical protein
MSNHSEFRLATILAMFLLIALAAFHFNDELFFGHSEDSAFTTEEARQDELAPDLVEESDY